MRKEKVLKACLSRKPAEERTALERFLPDEERMALSEFPPFDEQGAEFPTAIHWSWFLPILREEPPELQSVYLSGLSSYSATRLSSALGLEKAPKRASEVVAEFLHHELLKKLRDQELIPVEYLPSSPLKELLLLSKQKLIKLIDCLGLYDFAFEFRQILETKNLKKIYSFLTDEQRDVLGKLSAPKDTKPLPEMGLARWTGTEEELRGLLHRRGLSKLGIALSIDDPDLIWTICHHLDSGRGSHIMKFVGKDETPYAENARKQIVELLSLL